MDFFGQQLKTIQNYYKDPFEGQQLPTTVNNSGGVWNYAPL